MVRLLDLRLLRRFRSARPSSRAATGSPRCWRPSASLPSAISRGRSARSRSAYIGDRAGRPAALTHLDRRHGRPDPRAWGCCRAMPRSASPRRSCSPCCACSRAWRSAANRRSPTSSWSRTRRPAAGRCRARSAASGYAIGIQLASLTALACASLLTPAELQAWGWRIPFWLSLLVASSGLYVRSALKDAAAARGCRSVLAARSRCCAITCRWSLRIAALSLFASVGFQAAFIYVAEWLQTVAGASPADTFKVTSISMLAVTPVSLFFGWLADHVGRRGLLAGQRRCSACSARCRSSC